MLKMPLRVAVTAGFSVAPAGTHALPAAQGGGTAGVCGGACAPTVVGFGTRGGLTAQLELNPERTTMEPPFGMAIAERRPDCAEHFKRLLDNKSCAV
jgi:hypothetical protein